MSERPRRYFAVLLSPAQLDFSFAFLVKNVATRDMFNSIREGLLDSKNVFLQIIFYGVGCLSSRQWHRRLNSLRNNSLLQGKGFKRKESACDGTIKKGVSRDKERALRMPFQNLPLRVKTHPSFDLPRDRISSSRRPGDASVRRLRYPVTDFQGWACNGR